MQHVFCIKPHGTLKDILGEKICIELTECTNIYSLVEKIIAERKLSLSIDEVIIVSNYKTIDEKNSTCDIREVELHRVMHGG